MSMDPKWRNLTALLTVSSAAALLPVVITRPGHGSASGLNDADIPILTHDHTKAIVRRPQHLDPMMDPRADSEVSGNDKAHNELWKVHAHQTFSFNGSYLDSYGFAFVHGGVNPPWWSNTYNPAVLVNQCTQTVPVGKSGSGCYENTVTAFGAFHTGGFPPCCGTDDVDAQAKVWSWVYGNGDMSSDCGYDWDFERQPNWYESYYYYDLYTECHEDLSEHTLNDTSYEAQYLTLRSNVFSRSQGRYCRAGSSNPITCGDGLPESTLAVPAKPYNVHWKVGPTNTIQWRDGSIEELGWYVYRCGSSTPYTSVTSTSGEDGFGEAYELANVPIPDDTSNRCYQLAAYNAAGHSPLSAPIYFLNTTRGNCGSFYPCDHDHNGAVRIVMLASRATECATAIDYYVWNQGWGTALGVTVRDSLFGADRYQSDLGTNVWSGWRQLTGSGTNQFIAVWKATWEVDPHWDGVNYQVYQGSQLC